VADADVVGYEKGFSPLLIRRSSRPPGAVVVVTEVVPATPEATVSERDWLGGSSSWPAPSSASWGGRADPA
jgi:hypothetical protein